MMIIWVEIWAKYRVILGPKRAIIWAQIGPNYAAIGSIFLAIRGLNLGMIRCVQVPTFVCCVWPEYQSQTGAERPKSPPFLVKGI